LDSKCFLAQIFIETQTFFVASMSDDGYDGGMGDDYDYGGGGYVSEARNLAGG
jgi:hypothetical protein